MDEEEEEEGEPKSSEKIDAIFKHRPYRQTSAFCGPATLFALRQNHGIKRIDSKGAGSSIEAQGHEIFRKKICSEHDTYYVILVITGECVSDLKVSKAVPN